MNKAAMDIHVHIFLGKVCFHFSLTYTCEWNCRVTGLVCSLSTVGRFIWLFNVSYSLETKAIHPSTHPSLPPSIH